MNTYRLSFLTVLSFVGVGYVSASAALVADRPVEQRLCPHNADDLAEPDCDAKKLKDLFKNPPKGYGNVPFYWWNGDSIDRERLSDQLQILADGAVDGFSVSYIHTHPQIDKALNAGGYGSFGKADPGAPAAFSDEWWDTWNWFAGKCADKGIGLGLDDYVLGWKGNGYYVDEVLSMPSFAGYPGRLEINKRVLRPDERFIAPYDSSLISLTMYPSGKSFLPQKPEGRLEIHNDTGVEQVLYEITASPSPELHPDYGRLLTETYFDRFEQRLDAKARQSLDYFFQDELDYKLNIRSWAEDMPVEFMKRKGYDVRPYLAALFDTIGPITPKVRLDYADVVTRLSEERYFKPVFDWHNDRGLIYGCDNLGRGLQPTEYLDYFRLTSWFTAPGNDAPAKGSSFRQTKVSSSISHVYGRPRTWLEAFHSMGWDSNGEWLTYQLDHHLIAGGNLLCMHGLYYSTHGGWWEWAPPCFHFRMPYWPHMKEWLTYARRMCFVLSQGHHVCDISILYPTESMQAYPEASAKAMWDIAERLSACGLDYDFVDFRSVSEASIANGRLEIGDESYRVLILPDVMAMHASTLDKIYEFSQRGGIVLSTDNSFKATSRRGEGDVEALSIWRSIFNGDGQSRIIPSADIPGLIPMMLTPDFSSQSKKGRVLHRRIGVHDLYMVMDVEKGDELFFRAKGDLERWNAKDGTVERYPVLRQDDTGTWIKVDEGESGSILFMFSPGQPLWRTGKDDSRVLVKIDSIGGEWDVDILPTMDNKWGDFRLPASDELIGPEAREFCCRYLGDRQSLNDEARDVYGFGPFMEMRVIDAAADIDAFLAKPGFMEDAEGWKPYVFSWQYGVKDSPGSQGYHGLKAKVDDRFLILDRGGHQIYRTYLYASDDGLYQAVTEGVRPHRIFVDGQRLDCDSIELEKGWHSLVLAYADTPAAEYSLGSKKEEYVDNRQRSAVVFFRALKPELNENDPYGDIVAMKWYGSRHLPYSLVKGDGLWEYSFETAPGTRYMDLNVNGKITEIRVDGHIIDKSAIKCHEAGCRVEIGQNDGRSRRIRLIGNPEIGFDEAAFFNGPVKFNCGKGKLEAGNWTNQGGLKYYSGGMRYIKTVAIKKVKDMRVELDLGLVDATCEISVNGKRVNYLMGKPYSLDITDFVEDGDNEIEVLVYSSLSNHLQTVPSSYRSNPRSGLIGPVSLKYYMID